MPLVKIVNEQPVVFWHSDPVGPDETIMLSGHLLGKGSKVELVQLENGKPGKACPEPHIDDWNGAVPPEIISQSENSMAFVVPADMKQGIYACRILRAGRHSAAFWVNAPDIWWFQGDSGLNATTGGSWLRVLGKSLNF